MASTSRMLARNLLPSPSPLLAPSTRPPMSTTWTAAWTTFLDFDIAARRSSRSSGTLATPMFGSFVANGYGAASAPPPVSALYSELLPALGRPTRPKRSMRPPEATGAPTAGGRRERNVKAPSVTPSVRSRCEALDGLVDRRDVALRHPPAHQVDHVVHPLEPLRRRRRNGMYAVRNTKSCRTFRRRPHRQVDDGRRVVVGTHVARRLPAVVGEPPHEAGRRLGQGVDLAEGGDELGGVGVLEGLA